MAEWTVLDIATLHAATKLRMCTYEVSSGLMSKLVGVPGTVDELLSVLTAACSVGESPSPRRARYRAPENAYNKMRNMMPNWTTSIKTTRKKIREKAPGFLTTQK